MNEIIKIEFKEEDQCPICAEKFLDQDKKISKNVMHSSHLGFAHTVCMLPYHKEEDIKILFKIRCYSIGDAIASSVALREVKRNYPKSKIHVMTWIPDLYKYNPHIQGIIDLNKPFSDELIEDFLFELDSFDTRKLNHFTMHSVEFAMHCTLKRTIYPYLWDYELHYSNDERMEALKIAEDHELDLYDDKIILIHPHKTEWETRDWGPKYFPDLVKMLKEKYPNYKIVSIGGKRSEVKNQVMKNYVHIDRTIDLYGKLSLLGSAALMDFPAIKLLITPDTGTLHLGATRPELPIVGIFTLIKSYFRTPVRHGKFSYKFIGVESESDCNCTYTNRFLTNEVNFMKCPKKKFLENNKELKIPFHLKKEGLSNLFPEEEWKEINLENQIDQKIKEFQNLPCFPSVERVMHAVERALTQWTN